MSSKNPKRIIDYFIMIYEPSHERAVARGYVPEQILVAEKALGRPLTPDEDVKHINGDTQNNDPSNLEIISSNSGYKTQVLGNETVSRPKKIQSCFVSCKFNKVCWKTIREPIAKKNNIYLPFLCSWQSEGDIYSCGHFWNFIDKVVEEEQGSSEDIG